MDKETEAPIINLPISSVSYEGKTIRIFARNISKVMLMRQVLCSLINTFYWGYSQIFK